MLWVAEVLELEKVLHQLFRFLLLKPWIFRLGCWILFPDLTQLVFLTSWPRRFNSIHTRPSNLPLIPAQLRTYLEIPRRFHWEPIEDPRACLDSNDCWFIWNRVYRWCSGELWSCYGWVDLIGINDCWYSLLTWKHILMLNNCIFLYAQYWEPVLFNFQPYSVHLPFENHSLFVSSLIFIQITPWEAEISPIELLIIQSEEDSKSATIAAQKANLMPPEATDISRTTLCQRPSFPFIITKTYFDVKSHNFFCASTKKLSLYFQPIYVHFLMKAHSLRINLQHFNTLLK